MSHWSKQPDLLTFPSLVPYVRSKELLNHYDDIIKWKHFPHNWPFVRGIHRSQVNSPHKDQWCGALMFSLIGTQINSWVKNGKAGDWRRHRTHYDIIVVIALNNRVGVFLYYYHLTFFFHSFFIFYIRWEFFQFLNIKHKFVIVYHHGKSTKDNVITGVFLPWWFFLTLVEWHLHISTDPWLSRDTRIKVAYCFFEQQQYHLMMG